MNPWKVLKIKPTVDTKIIKKAYSILLKSYHPEENPNEFMNLRIAYEKALEEVVHLNNINENDKFLGEESSFKGNKAYPLEGEFIDKGNLLDNFIDDVSRLYDDFFARIESNNWEKLFSKEVYKDIYSEESTNLRLLYFLNDNHNLPNSVWRVIDSYLFWSKRKDIYKIFSRDFIDYVIDEINNTWGLRYDYFEKNKNCNYDEFIILRNKVHKALGNNELETIETSIEAATKIFECDPDLIRLEGQYYVRKGEDEKAIEVFSKLIEINPLEIDGYLNRAILLERKGMYKEAYYDYQIVLEINKKELRALIGIAEYYLHSDNLKEAKIILEKAVLEYPSKISLRIRLGDVNTKILEQAYSDYYENIRAGNGYEIAKICFDKRCYEKSEEILKKMIDNNILSSEVYRLLGLIYVEYFEYEKSINWLNKAIALEYEEGKNAHELLLCRGKSYMAMENFTSAIVDFLYLNMLYPDYDEISYNLSLCYREGKEYEKALTFINRAIENNSYNWKYYSARGMCYYFLNRFKEAKNDYEIVVDYDEKSPKEWAMKAYCHLMTAEYGTALETYETAFKWGNVDDYHYYYIAGLYLKFDNGDKAEEYIEKYLLYKTDDYLGNILAGDIHRHNGNIEKAIAFYEKARSINEDEHIAYLVLAYIYMDTKFYSKAVENFLKVAEKCYEDKGVIVDSIWTCILNQDWKVGKRFIETYDNFIKINKIGKDESVINYEEIILYNLKEYIEHVEPLEIPFGIKAYHKINKLPKINVLIGDENA